MEKSFLRKLKTLLLLSGMIYLQGCNSPSLEAPVTSCVLTFEHGRFNCGPRILDYKVEREKVGEWQNIELNVIGSLDEIPHRDLVCVTMEDWLLKVKPTLKKGHDYWIDYKGKMR